MSYVPAGSTSYVPADTPLRRAMRARGITQRDLADTVEYGETWLSRITFGRARPSPKLRRKIARALELPESELFDEDGMVRKAAPSSNGDGR